MEDYRTAILSLLQNIPPTEKSVIIYDIDDTLISSSTNLPITPITDTYHYALQRGFKVVLITARAGFLENILRTQEQLNSLSLTNYHFIYFRPPDKQDVEDFKLKAREHVFQQGFIAEMSIGDMPWDIGQYGGIGIHLK